MNDGDADAWKENAQNGWAALHNIREVLTQLAPPGSLPAEEEFTYGRSTCTRPQC